MRLAILVHLLCALVCVAANACGRDFDCERDNSCPPANWGKTVASSSGGAGGAGPGGSGAAGDTGASGGSSGAASSGPVCPEDPDPAQNYIPDECGVWVSHSLGDDDKGQGTQAAPVQSIARAIELAQSPARPPRVYACAEIFAKSVRLPKGITLFGGYDCAAPSGPLQWLYKGYEFRATLSPPPGSVALVFLGGDGDAKSLAGDLVAKSADSVEPGGSSIAVLAQADANVEGRRIDVIAGNGADGADGAPGDYMNKAAKAGLSGNDGADACTVDIGTGGLAVTVQCDDGTKTTGGYGGDGNEVFASDGHDGDPLPAPNPQGYGLAGKGETAVTECTGGAQGAQGINGKDGAPGVSNGNIINEKYVGASGGDGESGTQGQGGGGGGASRGAALCGAKTGGGGGGSGGTGGCGGRAGKGGQAGGSSIGIVSSSDKFIFYGGSVLAGNGGNGGNGGAGQPGGQIGLPGKGGLNFGGPDGVKAGCAGGAGGPGGNGGPGGGGHGGHSVLAAAVWPASTVPVIAPTSYTFGLAGAGGHSGNPNLMNIAPDGIAWQTLHLDP